jgi:spore germination protein GerM
MKKSFILLLCIVLIFSLCACRQKHTDFQEPVNFYYCADEVSYNTSDAVIGMQVHEGVDFYADSEKMLKSYLRGPKSNDYTSLIPTGTALISYDVIGDVCYLKFSDEFAKLSGIRLSAACSCIVLTLNDYSGVETVSFSTQTQQLDNKDELVISASDIILLDDEGIE